MATKHFLNGIRYENTRSTYHPGLAVLRALGVYFDYATLKGVRHMKIFFPTITEKSGFSYTDTTSDCIQKRFDEWLFNGGYFKLAVFSTILSFVSVILALSQLALSK